MIKQKVKPNDVIVTSKYLNSKRIDNLGIIITRTEISDNVKRDLVRIWKEENKLILVISDEDLIDMITLKEDDNEPEKIIEKLIFDFRRSLD